MRFRNPVTRLLVHYLSGSAVAAVVLVVLASVGYMVLESYEPLEAVYMTVITLGTIGYGEVQPLDTLGRIFTIGVIFAGFTLILYTTARFTQLIASGQLRAALREHREANMRDELHDHVIVIGFGRVGKAVTAALVDRAVPCVVIDPEPHRAAQIEAAGAVPYIADATNEEVLEAAGLTRARSLVAATDDQTNLVVVLTARALRPDLRIISRVNDPAWEARLLRAGASRTLAPYQIVGGALAVYAMRAPVVDLHDLPSLGLRTEEIEVPDDSPVVGSSLDQLAGQLPGVVLLDLRRRAGGREWCAVEGPVQAGDVVVALGRPDTLVDLDDRLSGR